MTNPLDDLPTRSEQLQDAQQALTSAKEHRLNRAPVALCSGGEGAFGAWVEWHASVNAQGEPYDEFVVWASFAGDQPREQRRSSCIGPAIDAMRDAYARLADCAASPWDCAASLWDCARLPQESGHA